MQGEETGTRHGFDTSRPVRSFFEVVREVLLNPRGFFVGLESSGGGLPGREKAPLIFAMISTYIALLLTILAGPLNRLLDPLGTQSQAPFWNFFPFLRENPGLGLALAAAFLVLLPLFVLIGAYIGSAVQHLFVMLFVRDRGTFYDTFAVSVYESSAISLLSWVPILGFLAGLYGIYVRTLGLREMHGTTTTRALLATLIPYLLGLLLTLPALLDALSGSR